jgi:hypothetical protein
MPLLSLVVRSKVLPLDSIFTFPIPGRFAHYQNRAAFHPADPCQTAVGRVRCEDGRAGQGMRNLPRCAFAVTDFQVTLLLSRACVQVSCDHRILSAHAVKYGQRELCRWNRIVSQ